MEKPIDWNDPYTTCDICGEKVLRGIITVSQHFVEKHYKQQFDNIMKIKDMPLCIKDKIDLVKNEFNINQ